jgi:hypothetical protein
MAAGRSDSIDWRLNKGTPMSYDLVAPIELSTNSPPASKDDWKNHPEALRHLQHALDVLETNSELSEEDFFPPMADEPLDVYVDLPSPGVQNKKQRTEKGVANLCSSRDFAAAYREACEKCPYLVATESNPIRFMRACDEDPWKAARKLARWVVCNFAPFVREG